MQLLLLIRGAFHEIDFFSFLYCYCVVKALLHVNVNVELKTKHCAKHCVQGVRDY